MKLTKRGRIWMLDVYIAGKRVRKSTGAENKQIARDRAVNIIAQLRAEAGECGWTLEQAMLDTYARIWSRQKSSVHVHKRIMKLSRDYPAWADLTVDKLDYAALDRLGQAMEKAGSKPATVNRFLALISKALTEAVRYGKLEVRPQFPYRKEPRGKLRWITPDEEQAMLRECDTLWPKAEADRLKALIVVLVDTGGRLSEVLGCARLFNMDRITFSDTKNGGTRSVPLTARATAMLPYVPQWTVMQAIGRFTRLRAHCELDDVSLHTLRHTCASRLVQGGMDLYRVKEWLGHSSITVTQRYAHLSPTNLDTGIAILQGAHEPIGEDTPAGGLRLVSSNRRK